MLSSDSEIDEATKRELEVREARRMQALAREGMDDADFGLPIALRNAGGAAEEELSDDEGGKKALVDGKKAKRKSKEQAKVSQTPELFIAGIDPSAVAKGTGFSSGTAEERQQRRKELDAAQSTSAVTSTFSALVPQLDEKTDVDELRSALFAQLELASPETIALGGEYADIVEDWAIVGRKLKELGMIETSAIPAAISAKDEEDADLDSSFAHIHAQALNAYVTNLTFWFYLRSTPKYIAEPRLLLSHPVMERLLTFKRTLMRMEEMGFGLVESKRFVLGQDAEEEEEEDLEDEEDEALDSRDLELDDSEEDSSEAGTLDEDELAGLYEDEQAAKAKVPADDVELKAPASTAAKTTKEKKKRKAKAEAPAPAPLAELQSYDAGDDFASLLAASAKGKKRARSSLEGISDADAEAGFGEPTQLTEQEKAERDAKRRSLKFYTSQINAKEARKGAALSKRDKLSGDMDIPYRDKQASRDAVERTKSAARAAASGAGLDSALDEGDFSASDAADRAAVMGYGGADFGEDLDAAKDDAADYYDLVTSSRQAAKRQKKEEYDTLRQEVRNSNADDGLEPGTHRAINRQIEKNKGLAPYRPKSVRNPRVKKRQKYDKAKKKLGSMQAVYKGGLGSLEGGYQGEKSGISSNVVKSRKFD